MNADLYINVCVVFFSLCVFIWLLQEYITYI